VRDLYPSLPEKEYTASRLLRVFVFAFVVSTLAVSAFVVAFRWLWDRLLGKALHGVFPNQVSGEPYSVRIELLIPAIIVITLLVARSLWNTAPRTAAPR